ncbi:MAG: peroxiredoxin [Candidatus Eisenbacteria bacterium]
MSLRLGDLAPDFEAQTTQGPIRFHEWLAGQWCVLFSHPGDFTPVCTTEIGSISRLKGEFDRRGVKVLGLSIDSLGKHTDWMHDIEASQGICIRIPLIADPGRRIAALYDMVHPNAAESTTVRTLFIIDADKKVRLTTSYPPSVGRNFEEVLRAIDALKLTSEHSVLTPANWERGDEVIIAPALSDEAANSRFAAGFRAELPYLRYTKDPSLRVKS